MNKSGVYPGWKAKAAADKAADDAAQAAKTVVTVTPIVESGTKIASIAVDGNSTDLYAPAVKAGTATAALLPDPIAITVNVHFDDVQSIFVADKTFTEIANAIDEYSSDYEYVTVKVTGDTYAGFYAGYHIVDGDVNIVELHQMGLTALNFAYPVFEDNQVTGYVANVTFITVSSDETLNFGASTLTIQAS